uniref:Signal peptidase complex subunit 3 n=1 Tax=Chlamydomonas leiostraca TaxID=1034604 RepID=A0A7S0RAM1_9CHLO|mmetsp:Transcript_17828/g.44965  ORF Transcript_17828/g.44965 Transcript_17828/m.44965 type:complete len:171 (+) Transcript_17828:56-568(+)
MHSVWHRANTLATFFGTVAGVLAILTTSTDLLHKADPKVKISVAEVKKLSTYQGTRDQAVITFNLDADLRSVFSWNTKQLFVYLQAEYSTKSNGVNQVVLWDSIVQQKDKAYIRLKGHKTKYAFIDHGTGMHRADMNLTLVWDVMPRVGYLYQDQRSVNIGSLKALQSQA